MKYHTFIIVTTTKQHKLTEDSNTFRPASNEHHPRQTSPLNQHQTIPFIAKYYTPFTSRTLIILKKKKKNTLAAYAQGDTSFNEDQTTSK